MATRKLSEEERKLAQKALSNVREFLTNAAGSDSELLWALRRYVYIRLQHDERGKPQQRRILKLKKKASQRNLCAECGSELPERGAELDRLDPMLGYTEGNTRLLYHECHRKLQAERGLPLNLSARICFSEGHDFSRAAKDSRMERALAPEASSALSG